MIVVEQVAKVTYTTELSKEQEKMVMDYIANHSEKFGENDSLDEKLSYAVRELRYELKLYDTAVESDFLTESTQVSWEDDE